MKSVKYETSRVSSGTVKNKALESVEKRMAKEKPSSRIKVESYKKRTMFPPLKAPG